MFITKCHLKKFELLLLAHQNSITIRGISPKSKWYFQNDLFHLVRWEHHYLSFYSMLCDELAFVYSTTWCHSLDETWYKPMTTLFAGAYPSLYVTISHYADVIMTTMASQITSLTVVYSIVYSDADQSKHQSSASLVFVWGIHRGPVNSPHKGPVTRKMFPFDDVIMLIQCMYYLDFPGSAESANEDL